MPHTDDSNDSLASLESLQSKIDAAKSLKDKDKEEKAHAALKPSNQLAHVASGLVAGAAVGGVAGYLVDRWLDISPIGLVIGFFLGFAAAVYNLMHEMEKNSD